MSSWIEWKGGSLPTSERVDVEFRNGDVWTDYTPHLLEAFFRHDRAFGKPENDIVAYRLTEKTNEQ